MTGSWGQDWASYQSKTPAAAGLDFAFVKATEGSTYTNPNRAAQVAHAHANGLVVGQYHYPHMGANAVREADYFLKVADPQAGELIALDWEGYDKANANVPMATQIAYRRAWLAHVQAAMGGHQVGTYCNTDYHARDPHGFYGDFLWIATAGRPAGLPGIDGWLFHQYSAATVDRDYCPLSPDALATWANSKEIDMTPDQAKQLADLHALLVPYGDWGYRNEEADAASVKAGKGHIPDAYGYLVQTHTGLQQIVAQNAALVAAMAKLGAKGGLTADQITAAAKAGADAALAELADALKDSEPTPDVPTAS